MDREDARFVVSALESRLKGDRAELDRLAADDVLRLAAAASRLKGLGADWPPALSAAFELNQIARHGGKVVDEGAGDVTASDHLKIFVDKLRELADEPPTAPPPRNRAERRAQIARLPRDQRIAFPHPRIIL